MRLAMLVTILMCCAAAAEVRTVRVPDGGLAPQAAVDGKGVIHLIYFKGEAKAGDIYYTTSADGAKSFGKAIRVNSEAGTALIAGTIRGPHLALGRDGRPHVAWMGSYLAARSSPTKDTPMLYTRLGDDGQFEPQRNVIAQHVGMDGGGSVAADEDGNVYVAWHAPEKKDGNEASRKVWVAHSSDDGKTFSPEVAASADIQGACACCSLRAVAGANGTVIVLFRRATNGTERGTVMLSSADAGKTFASHEINPMTSGMCIMSSFAITPAGKTFVLGYEQLGKIRYVEAETTGGFATKMMEIGDGKHPAIAINAAGKMLIVRAVGTGFNRGGSLAWTVSDRGGMPTDKGSAKDLPASSIPTAVALPSGDFVIVY